jgi:hypothetical protein
LENILNQNYIEYEGKLYKPSKGRARGLPVWGIIAEIFTQSIELEIMKHIMENKHLACILFCDNSFFFVDSVCAWFQKWKMTEQNWH